MILYECQQEAEVGDTVCLAGSALEWVVRWISVNQTGDSTIMLASRTGIKDTFFVPAEKCRLVRRNRPIRENDIEAFMKCVNDRLDRYEMLLKNFGIIRD